MSLNTVPTNYHEFEYAKFFLFKLKFMNTGRIHAERWCDPALSVDGARPPTRARCEREPRERVHPSAAGCAPARSEKESARDKVIK